MGFCLLRGNYLRVNAILNFSWLVNFILHLLPSSLWHVHLLLSVPLLVEESRSGGHG